MTRSIASEFLWGRNSETSIYVCIYIYIHTHTTLSSFRGFSSHDFSTGEYKELTLGFPGYRNTETSRLKSTLDHFGVSLIGILELASTMEFTLRCLGYQNTETSQLIHASSFRGFANRDFRTGEYKGTYP
jgi:hypothetical protein